MDLNFFEIDGYVYADGEWVDVKFPSENNDGVEIDAQINPAFRRIIGTGNNSDDFDEGGNLIDNRRHSIYKLLINPTKEMLDKNFVIFHNELNSAICIRQMCEKCEFNNGCERKIAVFDNNTNEVIKEMESVWYY